MDAHNRLSRKSVWSFAAAVWLAAAAPAGWAEVPLGSAWTFQGLFQSEGQNVTDDCDFVFMLFDDPHAGLQVGPTLTFDGAGANQGPVAVVDGIFSVKLDFGPAVFDGEARWLAVSVRCPSGVGTYQPLGPRQPICATPYALYAANGGGFGLPFAAAVNLQQDAFAIANTGGGRAAVFEVNDPSLPSAPLPTAAPSANENSALAGTFFEAVDIQSNAPATALRVIARGPEGGAGSFEILDDTSVSAALAAQTTSPLGTAARFHKFGGEGAVGSGPAQVLLATTQGGGSVCLFDTFNTTETQPTLLARMRGRGPAGRFEVTNPDSSNLYGAIEASNSGGGSAGVFHILNANAVGIGPTNNEPAVDAKTVGYGPAGVFEIDRLYDGTVEFAPNSAPALHLITNAAGPAALIENNRTGAALVPTLHVRSAAPDTLALFESTTQQGVTVMKVTGEGGGIVGDFEMTNPAGESPVVQAFSNGTGPAGRFQVNNAAAQSNALEAIANNSLHALFAQQTGAGEAAHFEIADPGNGNLAVFVKNNGTGIALQVMNTNPFFGALALGVIGKSAFNGPVDVIGNMIVQGNIVQSGAGELCATSICAAVKQFQIDHPLDPENKYLRHASIESDEMKNVYDGTVVLDASGEAVVSLPAWFEALNRDFRYQLTCIDGFAPVYIADEIAAGCFRIAGGRPGLKVSWQVTGVRQDRYARENPLQVEVDKETRVARADAPLAP